MSYYTSVSNDYLREVIKGKVTFRKCPCCDNDGIEIQCYDDNGEPCTSDHPEARREVCENCYGVAFMEVCE